MKTLEGRRILVTRPRRSAGGADPLMDQLRALGAEVLWLPGLEIGPPDDWRPLDEALSRLDSFDWVVFTSRNGAEAFLDRIGQLGLRWGPRPKAAAVGPKTAEALTGSGNRPVHVSPEPVAVALASSLAADAPGRRFLWPRAQVAPDSLAAVLRAAGAAEVTSVPAYAARAAPVDAAPVREALLDKRVDAVVFTSARSIEAVLAALGAGASEWLSSIPRVCIGPVTGEACRALGLGVPVVSEGPVEGIVQAIVRGLDS